MDTESLTAVVAGAGIVLASVLAVAGLRAADKVREGPPPRSHADYQRRRQLRTAWLAGAVVVFVATWVLALWIGGDTPAGFIGAFIPTCVSAGILGFWRQLR